MEDKHTPVGTSPTVFYSHSEEKSVVPTGFPSPASDYMEQPIDLNEHIIEHPSATFYMRFNGGDSMLGAHILPNALLVIDRALEPCHGNIMIVVVDGEFMVRRLEKKGDKLRLLAEHPKYHPIEVNGEREIELWGVVTYILLNSKTV